MGGKVLDRELRKTATDKPLGNKNRVTENLLDQGRQKRAYSEPSALTQETHEYRWALHSSLATTNNISDTQALPLNAYF